MHLLLGRVDRLVDADHRHRRPRRQPALGPGGHPGADEEQGDTDDERGEPGLDRVGQAQHAGRDQERETEEAEERGDAEPDGRRADLDRPRPDAARDRVDLVLDGLADVVLGLLELLARPVGERLGQPVEEAAGRSAPGVLAMGPPRTAVCPA